MTRVTVKEAETQLSRLIQAVREGEEVIITEDSQPVVKLVSILEERQEPRSCAQFGSGKGLFRMAPDFDAPLEDFKEYME